MIQRPTPPAGAELAFRLLFSGIFVMAGLQHLARPSAVLAHLGRTPLGAAARHALPVHALVVLSGVALLAGGVGLLSGTLTRAAALGLAAVVAPITVIVQLGPDTLGPLFKNLAILGGLVHFAVNGAGALSVDALRRARRPHAAMPAAEGAP